MAAVRSSASSTVRLPRSAPAPEPEKTIAIVWNPDFDPDGAWREGAACRDVDPNLFFPAGTTGAAAAQIDRAKAYCRGCPVRQECLQFAIATSQDHGVWGGTDEDERWRLRRAYRRRRATSPSR